MNDSIVSMMKAVPSQFSSLLREPNLRSRWEKVRKFFYLRESTYDISNRCNLNCDGCYYYKGEKFRATENRNPDDWRQLMRAEKERGVTFVVLAGAEPALEPDLLRVCYEEMPLGCIATNGIKHIPDSIGYRIHISVWGNDRSNIHRQGEENILPRQLDNYRGDERAVFVYTFTRNNIDEAPEVVETLVTNGCTVTFNMFSSPIGYQGNLRHTEESLLKTRECMLRLLELYPEQVLFSSYNSVVHTFHKGLHDTFSCPYPRMNPSSAIGLGRSFRQYRTDLTWNRTASCCVPDTDCSDCRHYASGSAIVTARLHRHAEDRARFTAWLDYVDTYLAVWVMGYKKGENLNHDRVAPPGFDSC
jgi:MoaA/NifB/PqqE/SkfB family radical SAM enzyme